MAEDTPNQNPKKSISIKAKDKVLAGTYANMAQVSHTKEEFILDFMTVVSPTGSLNARVIVSPSHMKRMIRAFQENLSKYESKFGLVEETKQPDTHFGWPIK